MKNQFGKVSSLNIAVVQKEGKTILSDVSFTAPFKVMTPFEKPGGRQIMMLSASAGVMAGDTQSFSFDIGRGANLEFISQSFEKIHKMKEGHAGRRTSIRVGREAVFDYYPLPTIPFAGSAYESVMTVELADDTSQFGMYEILSCGRGAMGERFAYRYYHSLIEIKRGKAWVYRDNTRYEPEDWEMEGMGMYESYTHLANVFMTAGRLEACTSADEVRDIIGQTPETEGAVTRLASGDYAIRIFGNRAQDLQRILEKVLRPKAIGR